MLAIAVVCGLATAPVVLVHFGEAPVYTVLANAVAFPAVPLVLAFGLLAAAVDPVSPEAAGALAWLAGWAAAWLELVARIVASLPGAQVGARTAGAARCSRWPSGRPSRYGGARLDPRRRALALVLAGVLLFVGAGWWAARAAPTWQPPAGLRVTFLDVGQGDAVLLETPSGRVLVDQGPPEADVAGQLAGMGVRSLSALVLTHPQRDHVGGAADVIRRLRVGTVLDPHLAATGPEREEALAAARERRVPIGVAREDAEFRVGGLVLRVLWPPDPGLPAEDPNLNAVVLVASFGEIDVFLPADAESDVTEARPGCRRDPEGRASRVGGSGTSRGAARPPTADRGHLGRAQQRLRTPAAGDPRRARDRSGARALPNRPPRPRRRRVGRPRSRGQDGGLVLRS